MDQGGYNDERHVALFAGIAPVSNPRIVMVVVVNEPQSGSASGGQVAAPIFARVAQHSLRLLGVMPDKDGEGGDEPLAAGALLAKRGQ